MMYIYSEEGVKSSENSSTPKKEVCTMFRSLFRSSFSRRRGGGNIPAKGNRTLFGVVGATRAVIANSGKAQELGEFFEWACSVKNSIPDR